MKIVITGGGGFLGLRLAKTLLARGTLVGPDGAARKIARISLLDTAFQTPVPVDARLEKIVGDLSDERTLASVVTPDTASVFHLAAVVSGGAEADFDLGMRINLDGTRRLLERCRQCEHHPRVVFASSVAAFGGELPPVLDDSITPAPQTSYGTQKVIGEYLLSDFTRKGYVDGRALRLPTIVVRPGKANAAASSFASAIVREPLNGVVYECPVEPETGIWLLSPKRVVESFIHAHELESAAWGAKRAVNLPGITATIPEMIDALRRVAGAEVAKRVSFKPETRIVNIVKTWPVRFETPRALAMGFRPDPGIESIIRDYIADEGINVK